jgi:hypothetical protein
MPIPALDQDGLLPVGVHECTLSEIRSRFGSFQTSDQRPRQFARLETFVAEASATGLIRVLIVDGSFVTQKPSPNDIDLIVVVESKHDFSSDIGPRAYNILSKNSVRRRFGFDLLVARENSVEYNDWVEFFQQVRLEPGRRKGILRLRL